MLVIDLRAEQTTSPHRPLSFTQGSPRFAELARFYAQHRGIRLRSHRRPDLPTDEEITREEYDANIAGPLREAFKTRKWWTVRETSEQQTAVMTTSIRFVAVIKGVPLKIKTKEGPYPGNQSAGGPVSSRNEASVDSELESLGLFSRQISGPLRIHISRASRQSATSIIPFYYWSAA